MAKADVEGARKYARSYLEYIKPRWEELAGKSAKLTYSVELLRESLGVSETSIGIEISKKSAALLVRIAQTDPYAFQLYAELHALGEKLIGSGADTIRDAAVKKPTAQGNRDQNGVRDLVLSLLWAELQEFGLPKENKIRKGVRAITPSIGVVISEEIQLVIGLKIEPGAIMARVFDRKRIKCDHSRL